MPLVEPVPDIRSLDLLLSVAQLGSIRQASLRHGISQPAASMRLRSLEAVLGLQLLDRSQGRSQPTPAGLAVVRWSENVLEPMRDLLAGAQALRSEKGTHLRVVASMTVAEYLIPTWLNRLRIADPEVTVSLDMGNSRHGVEAIVAGEADIGFVEGPRASREVTSRVIFTDELIVVVGAHHRWTRRRSPLSALELASTPLVMREKGSGTRDVLDDALAAHGLTASPLVELGSTTAIKAAVASGAGAAILSRLAVATELEEGTLVAVALKNLALKRSIRAVWSRTRPLSKSAKLLLQHVG